MPLRHAASSQVVPLAFEILQEPCTDTLYENYHSLRLFLRQRCHVHLAHSVFMQPFDPGEVPLQV